MLPHGGGSANAYFSFSKGLLYLDVFAVQYPGRQDRVDDLGATVAFEVTPAAGGGGPAATRAVRIGPTRTVDIAHRTADAIKRAPRGIDRIEAPAVYTRAVSVTVVLIAAGPTIARHAVRTSRRLSTASSGPST